MSDTAEIHPTTSEPAPTTEVAEPFVWRPFWSTVASCLAAAGLCLAAGLAVADQQGRLAFQAIYAYAGTCALVALGLAAYWTEAALDGQLPPRPRQKAIDPHLSGGGVIGLLVIAALIVMLARWAGESQAINREIQSHWGVYITFGLAGAFLFAALAPFLDLERRTAGLAKPLDTLLAPVARLVSFIDSILVLVVAGLAGAGRTNLLLRYLLLAMTLAPCGVLGFVLPAPWGLIPIAWGFIVVIAVSRRWAWVEDDRELAMLNGQFTGSHLRIGFGQDLRDEALLGFMAMFFLVPLALRQAHLWTEDAGLALFEVVSGRDGDFLVWLGFFGSELAKAVPFVDWAEIYSVGSRAEIETDAVEGVHLIFMTRILVDLVFLAALLQALSISARSAKQRQLFFKDRRADGAPVLQRLDPFIETREFHKLKVVREPGKPPAITHPLHGEFPPYDTARLLALREEGPDKHIREVAKALLQRDGEDNAEVLHERLVERALAQKPDAAQLDEVIEAIRLNGKDRQIYILDQARQAIVRKNALRLQRAELVKLIAEASEDDLSQRHDRTRALIDVLEGPNRDAWGDVRLLAVEGLRQAAARSEQDVLSVLLRVGETDAHQRVRRRAKELATGLPA